MNWLLLFTGFMITITVFLLVFSFNTIYAKRTRLFLGICGIISLFISIYLSYLILSKPWLGL